MHKLDFLDPVLRRKNPGRGATVALLNPAVHVAMQHGYRASDAILCNAKPVRIDRFVSAEANTVRIDADW